MILLGGGIGAGKTVAGRRFEALGFVVVEADGLGHETLKPGGAAFGAVAARWPGVVVDSRIDRALLGATVFADADQLAELEAMTHPHILRHIEELGAGSDRLVVEIPVLLEPVGVWTKVYLASNRSTRRRRAVLRGGAAEDVDRRMQQQAEHAEWVAWADEIIENNGTIEDLNRAIDALVHRLEAPPVK